MMRISTILMMLFAASATPIATASIVKADTYPLTIIDGRDQKITFQKRPERVAALWTAAADLMVALGLPVAATTTYEGKRPVYLGAPMANAIDLGDLTAPNLEVLATSNIDLTIGMTRYNAAYDEDIEKTSQFITYNGFTLDQSYHAIKQMGIALGEGKKAETFNQDFQKLIKDMAAKAPEKGKSVLFIWSYQDALYGYHDNVLTAELISKLGTNNPLGFNEGAETADNAFSILEAEDLLKHNPDVILMFVSHGGGIKYNPVYERLKAYQNDQIFSVGYQYSQPAGPIAREMMLREAANLIYPDIFPKAEMPDQARAKKIRLER